MQLFINECSLHGQYIDLAGFRRALETMLRCATAIQSDFEVCRSYYAGGNLYVFLALADKSFWDTFNGITDNGFKHQIRQLLFVRLHATDWTATQIHDPNTCYECLSEDCVNTSIAEASERKRLDEKDPTILLNFQPSKFDGLLSVTVLKKLAGEEHETILDC